MKISREEDMAAVVSRHSSRPRGRRGGGRFTVMGNSMRFLLNTGDTIVCLATNPQTMRVGDIVVFVRSSFQKKKYIVHRLLWKRKRQGRWRLWTQGDWSAVLDAPGGVPVGKVVAIEKSGHRWVWEGNRVWLISAGVGLYSRVIFYVHKLFPKIKSFFFDPCLEWSLKGYEPFRLFFRRWLLLGDPFCDRLRTRCDVLACAFVEAVLWGGLPHRPVKRER